MSRPAPGPAALAAGYFWYFGVLGLFVPYWPIYLDERGYDKVTIGALMAVFAGLRVVGPPLYAHFADVTGRRMELMWAAAAGSLACVIAFPWLGGVVAIAIGMGVYSALWNGLMALYDADVLDRLDAEAGRYGRIRLWGSVGFVVTSFVGGWWLQRAGADAVPWGMAVLIGLTLVTILRFGRPPAVQRQASQVPLGSALRDPRVVAFLVVAFLMLASHGPYYTYLSLYLEQAGYSRQVVGALWAWAVVAEVAALMAAPWLVARYSLKALMLAALGATAVRWVALALFVDSPGIVFAAQTLHLASFGLFHLSSVALARQLFPAGAAARAQALHGSMGYGLGGIVGAFGSGLVWDQYGPSAPYLVAAIVVTLGFVVAALGLPSGRDASTASPAPGAASGTQEQR